ncbi:MAG: L-aspartate oxidase [Bacillota bacterium]
MENPLVNKSDSIKNKFDIIIIGTGIAGLYTALTLKDTYNIMLVTKDKIYESNSQYAQGGIAAALDESDFESHVKDTLSAGSYYNDEEAVNILVKEARENIVNLVDFGVNFDTKNDGNFLKTKEGGHSSSRILHYKDSTGKEIIRALSQKVKQKKNIHIFENTFAIDLLKSNEKVNGVVFEDKKGIFYVKSKRVVIACGGIGKLFKNSTNSLIATGDGIAMALNAGANVLDMEFIQFHPTALNIDESRTFLISEALRGEGAVLRNKDGNRFMEKYHELKELAPRDIVSQSIYKEMKKTDESGVYLDITHKDEDYVKNRFPGIYSHCLEHGIDITKEYIPVKPVQHYLMGGIDVDLSGQTSLKNLHACGEVARTGVHGANRLASNSLLEAIVLGNRISKDINSEVLSFKTLNNVVYDKKDIESKNDYLDYVEKIRNIMSHSAFIVRRKKDAKNALTEINKLIINLEDIDDNSIDYFQTMNMLIVSKKILIDILDRPESLGSHKIINDIMEE